MSPPINGVATSITAFIGSALHGPTDMNPDEFVMLTIQQTALVC